MHILNFLITMLQTYGLDIVIVIGMALFLTFLIRKGKKKLAFDIIYGLVVQAEQQIGSKTGQEKYAHVMAQVYSKLPIIVKLFFTQRDIERFIEKSVILLKKKLQNGDIDLLTYAQEQVQVNKPVQNITVHVTKPPDEKNAEDIAKEIAEEVEKEFN